MVDAARSGAHTCCEVASRATALLASRPATDIVAAHQSLWRLMDASYLRPLRAAAYLIRGGCSDHSFDYFRAYLLTHGPAGLRIGRGRPGLAGRIPLLTDPDGYLGSCEEFLSVTSDAHRTATGEDLPAEAWPPHQHLPLDPAWDFDFEDKAETRRRLPHLSSPYLP